MNKKRAYRALLCAVFMAMSCGVLAQDATLNQARQLIQSKQYRQAYALLAPQEQQRAGEVDFDYLLGIAAIDSGELTRGVFALERVLAVNPNHAQARAEIARAYFLMGENKTSRQEFEHVRQSNPPAQVNATIDQFLSALDARERSRRSGLTGYLEATVGHDTNVNSATSSTQFAIPVLAGAVFTLSPGSNEQEDTFLNLAGGVSGRYGINDTVGLIGSASFDQRLNFSEDRFNLRSLNASGGLSIRTGGDEFVLALQAQQFDVEDDRFRNAAGFVAQWRGNIGSNDQVSAYVQRTRLTYTEQHFRDADRTVVGGAWAHAYGGAGAPVVYAGLYAGDEATRDNAVPHFGHDLVGIRGGGQMALSEKWLGHVSLSYEDRKYGGADPFFLRDRHDKELQARVGATYSLSRHWSFTPALAYTNNKSNIVIYDYDRWIASVTARYDFR
jgi:tetratricopeptide (TPR) repeat protein